MGSRSALLAAAALIGCSEAPLEPAASASNGEAASSGPQGGGGMPAGSGGGGGRGAGGQGGQTQGAGGGEPAACAAHAAGELAIARSVTDFAGRDYLLRVPAGYDCHEPAPVVLALHGGGQNADRMERLACASDEPLPAQPSPDDPSCFNAVAAAKGFVLVYPNGTESSAGRRTFNAGGGANGYACVSGDACANGEPDVAYVDALLDDLATVVNVDEARLFATGASNGAAMAHRLACERADRFAAIAPVAGGNQLAAVQGCEPSRPVPVLQIHGDADPLWPYLGGARRPRGRRRRRHSARGDGRAVDHRGMDRAQRLLGHGDE